MVLYRHGMRRSELILWGYVYRLFTIVMSIQNARLFWGILNTFLLNENVHILIQSSGLVPQRLIMRTSNALIYWYMFFPDSKFHRAYMGPTWGDRTQVGPIWAQWNLLSGLLRHPDELTKTYHHGKRSHCIFVFQSTNNFQRILIISDHFGDFRGTYTHQFECHLVISICKLIFLQQHSTWYVHSIRSWWFHDIAIWFLE